MNLRLRLTLLFVLATLLPALPATWVTRDLLHRSLQISQRSEIDEGLEAGLRRSQFEYRRVQDELRSAARQWVAAGADSTAWKNPSTRIESMQGGVRRVLRAGAGELRAAEPTRLGAEVPDRLQVQVPGADGTTWVFVEAVDAQWRADAQASSEALQLVRGLSAERRQIEGAFLMPFLGIYAVGFLFSMVLAIWIARGITRPVRSLLAATEAVAAGQWQGQVRAEGPRELRRLATEFNRMVATLDAQNRQLIELETLAGWREMARALAHEVKNPLTPIQLTVEEMWHRYRGDDAEYRAILEECARIVIEEVESLREVVGRFREFSRPVELRPESLDLNDLVQDTARMQKDLEVELDLDPSLPSIEADPQRLRQLLMNLAANVRNLREDGVATSMALRTRWDGQEVLLEVEDDGPGIPEEERARVFDPYRSGRSGGLGLGLALVKGIVLAHHGRIEVLEGRSGGARFCIHLPAGRATPEVSA